MPLNDLCQASPLCAKVECVLCIENVISKVEWPLLLSITPPEGGGVGGGNSLSPVGTTLEAGQSISYQTGLLHTLCLGTFVLCLPLQYLLQSCSRWGRGIAEDMCYDALLLHLCNQITRGCFVALEINHFNCACEMMTFFLKPSHYLPLPTKALPLNYLAL